MKTTILAGVMTLLVLAGTIVLAQSDSGEAPSSPARSAGEPPADQSGEKHLAPVIADSPLHERIQAALEREQETMVALLERLALAQDESEILALQREAEALKLATEIDILRLQAEYARENDRVDQAERIEVAIDELLHPPILTRPEGSVPESKESGR